MRNLVKYLHHLVESIVEYEGVGEGKTVRLHGVSLTWEGKGEELVVSGWG